METQSLESQPYEVITRRIPVGYGGYIIGKNGTYKANLMRDYNACLYLSNDKIDPTHQIIEIALPKEHKEEVEKKIDEKLQKLSNNTVNTVTNNPEKLIASVEYGKYLPCFITKLHAKASELTLVLDQPEMNEKYSDMSNEMAEIYNNDKSCRLPQPFNQGCICVALSKNDKYYRAYIRQYMGILSYVYLLDVGRLEVIATVNLYKIQVRHLQLPFRAIFAKLNNTKFIKQTDKIEQILNRKVFRTEDNKVQRVFAFFTHSICDIPCVTINVQCPKEILSAEQSKSTTVDLLELLTALNYTTTVPSEIDEEQAKNYHKTKNFDTFYKDIVKFTKTDE